MRRNLRMVWMIVLMFGAAALSPNPGLAQDGPHQFKQCWSDAELRSRPGEAKIGRAYAYVRPPMGALHPKPVPAQWRGAIRRVQLPQGVNKIALTFDLCEQAHDKTGYDGAIVDLLRDTKTKATFFAGKWIVTHPNRAQQLIADPLFEVGNHTWEHRNLRLLTGKSLYDEIAAAQLAYAGAHSQLVQSQCMDPKRRFDIKGIPDSYGVPRLFRFPFGACNRESMQAVGDAGLLAIQWDVSSGDPFKGQDARSIAEAVFRTVRPGSIIIFHANGRGWHTAEALRTILPELRARQFELVTVTELLNTPGARPVITQTCYENRPGDTDLYDGIAARLETRMQQFKDQFHQPTTSAPENTLKQSVPIPVPADRKK